MKKEITNPETEQFCREIAEQYQRDQAAANLKFVQFVKENNVVRWEAIAMQDRVRYLIHYQ